MSRDQDDKPKRSWREIDRNKDKSKHRQPDRPAIAPHKQARAESASKVYRSKLDAFFSGEGSAPKNIKEKLESLESDDPETKARKQSLQAIKDAGTSAAVDKAVGRYLAKWELPPDFDVLAQVLICTDEEHINLAIEMMQQMYQEKHLPRRSQVLEQRLRRVTTLFEDSEVADKALELIRTVRLFSERDHV